MQRDREATCEQLGFRQWTVWVRHVITWTDQTFFFILITTSMGMLGPFNQTLCYSRLWHWAFMVLTTVLVSFSIHLFFDCMRWYHICPSEHILCGLVEPSVQIQCRVTQGWNWWSIFMILSFPILHHLPDDLLRWLLPLSSHYITNRDMIGFWQEETL